MLNFTENCTPDILTPYLDGIVSKLLVLLQVFDCSRYLAGRKIVVYFDFENISMEIIWCFTLLDVLMGFERNYTLWIVLDFFCSLQRDLRLLYLISFDLH